MMQVFNKCEICEINPSITRCRICERNVCKLDYDANSNVCISCKSAMCNICGKYLSIGVCKYCGRHACEDCLIELSLVEYICIECYEKMKGSVGGVVEDWQARMEFHE